MDSSGGFQAPCHWINRENHLWGTRERQMILRVEDQTRGVTRADLDDGKVGSDSDNAFIVVIGGHCEQGVNFCQWN